MERFKSIEEVLANRIKLKRLRSEYKFENIADNEKPREVYLKTCLSIANHLTDQGFSFSKSTSEITKKNPDKTLKLIVRFQSDYNNVAGIYVGLSAGVIIESITLKKWRKKYGIPGPIWGAIMVGDISKFALSKEILAVRWNLADKNEREIAIIEIVDLIENYVLPTFELFNNSELIEKLILEGNFILMNPLTNIQYILLNKSTDDARTATKNYLNKNKEAFDKYIVDNERIKKEGLPEIIYGYNQDIACFTNYYTLGDLF